MTIRKSVEGSGLTASEVYHFDTQLSDEEQKLYEQLTAEQTLIGRLDAIERVCVSVLEAASLPTGPSIEKTINRTYIANVPWPVLKRREFEPDRSEGFAARMLGDIASIRESLAEGNHERVGMLMFFLGVKWSAAGIKRRHGSRSHDRPPPKTRARDAQMAREFLRRKEQGSFLSDSALKADIGARQTPALKRSSAIEAVDRGLKVLSG